MKSDFEFIKEMSDEILNHGDGSEPTFSMRGDKHATIEQITSAFETIAPVLYRKMDSRSGTFLHTWLISERDLGRAPDKSASYCLAENSKDWPLVADLEQLSELKRLHFETNFDYIDRREDA